MEKPRLSLKPEQAAAVLAHKPERAAAVLGIGRSKVYELLQAGELESFKLGKSRLIPHASIERLIARKMGEAA